MQSGQRRPRRPAHLGRSCRETWNIGLGDLEEAARTTSQGSWGTRRRGGSLASDIGAGDRRGPLEKGWASRVLAGGLRLLVLPIRWQLLAAIAGDAPGQQHPFRACRGRNCLLARALCVWPVRLAPLALASPSARGFAVSRQQSRTDASVQCQVAGLLFAPCFRAPRQWCSELWAVAVFVEQLGGFRSGCLSKSSLIRFVPPRVRSRLVQRLWGLSRAAPIGQASCASALGGAASGGPGSDHCSH